MGYQIFVNNELYVPEVFANQDSALSFMNVGAPDLEEFEVRETDEVMDTGPNAKVYDINIYREVYRAKQAIRKAYG